MSAIQSSGPLLTLNSAAARCGLHRERLRKAICAGELPAYRIGAWWRVRASDLESWLETHRYGEPRVADPEARAPAAT